MHARSILRHAVLLVVGTGLSLGAAAADGGPGAKEVPPLTGADHIDIETLYGRTLHEEGRTMGTRYWLTNLVVEPVPGTGNKSAAIGWAYILHGRGREMVLGELYKDRLVKSGNTWKIAARERFPGTVMPPREHYPPPSNEHAKTFTARDYAEVERIVTRYNLGYDNARLSDQGALRDLSFAPDSVFERGGGTPAAAPAAPAAPAPAAAAPGGSPGLHHWDTNFLIDVSPTGEVTSMDYDMQFLVGENGTPITMRSGGMLVHTYTRTPVGWLIKYRRYDALRLVPKIAWPPSGYGVTASKIVSEPGGKGARGKLSVADHIEIEQLYAKTNVAFDSAADNGAIFANTFTADGSFVHAGGATTGHTALAALAAANAPMLHTWMSNLVLEPTRGGAKGRAYALNFTSDAPQSVNDVGTFEDVLVKTRDGWRFKTRTYKSDAR